MKGKMDINSTFRCDEQFKDFLSVLDNSIQVILTHRGIHYIARVPLGDAFDLADGPMSLESGCMSAVREICQAIYELKP